MSERADTLRCREIAAQPDLAPWRPVVDPLLDVVLADCPRCHAQDRDPQGLYRPVRIIPRRRRLTYVCRECGTEDVR